MSAIGRLRLETVTPNKAPELVTGSAQMSIGVASAEDPDVIGLGTSDPLQHPEHSRYEIQADGT